MVNRNLEGSTGSCVYARAARVPPTGRVPRARDAGRVRLAPAAHSHGPCRGAIAAGASQQNGGIRRPGGPRNAEEVEENIFAILICIFINFYLL